MTIPVWTIAFFPLLYPGCLVVLGLIDLWDKKKNPDEWSVCDPDPNRENL